MIIYDKEFCRIEFNKDNGVLSQHWNGFTDAESFKEAIMFTLDFFQKEPSAKYLISDTLNQKAVRPEDGEWVAKEINPLLVKAGLKKMAFVMPQNIITQIGVKNFSTKTAAPMNINFLTTFEDALKWITS